MKSETELIDKIESYLKGELNADEQAAIEHMRRVDPAFDHQVVAHKDFLSRLGEYADHKQLVARMNVIHEQLDVNGIKSQYIPQPARVITLWRKYKNSVAIAATVAIVATFATLFFSGSFAVDNPYNAMRRKMDNIQRAQTTIMKNMPSLDKPRRGPVNPGQFGGTGFALTADGYIVTNYHVIKGADSVYIQNKLGDSYKVKTVYTDEAYDLAILKITDASFTSLSTIPYSFKRASSDLGEDVYTLGYPRDEAVFGRGYVSSKTGFRGDTVAYQVSIPVNPGNSGGPLLDYKGNVIGVISGKQAQLDGAAFAIKSQYLVEAVNAIPSDSLEQKLILNKKNNLSNLSRTDQVKKIEEYIFMVKVY